jgi:hypothetical protein
MRSCCDLPEKIDFQKIRKKKFKKEKKEKFSQKPMYYRVIIFLTKYALASPRIRTAYLKPRAYLSFYHNAQSLMTLWGMLFFYINFKIYL